MREARKAKREEPKREKGGERERAGERTSRLSCFCKTYASISIMRFFAHAGVFFV